MKPIDGVDYVASDLGPVIEISWYSKRKEDWAAVLAFVRSIEGRRFEPISKCWQVPNNDSVRKMLTDAGWFGEKPKVSVRPKMSIEQKRKKNLYKVPRQFRDAYTSEEVIPTYDPEARQKEFIKNTELVKGRNIIPGLRDYQLDFLKFAQHRNGRVGLGDEMGCLDGSSLVTINRNGASKRVTLETLYRRFHSKSKHRLFTNEERPWFIRCLHQDDAFRLGQIVDVVQSGVKHCVEIELEDGYRLILTPDHRIKTRDGYVEASKSLGMEIVCNGNPKCKKCGCGEDIITYPSSKFLGYCRKCMYSERNGRRWKDKEIHEVVHSDGYVYLEGYPLRGYKGCRRTDGIPKHRYVMEQHLGRYLKPTEIVHHLDGNKLNNSIENLVICDDSAAHNAFHSGEFYKHFPFVNPTYHKVVSVRDVGERMTYDVKVLNHHNFVANGIVVHNCGKTLSALAWLVYADDFPAIIVVNAPTKLQWKQEYRKWLSKVKGCPTRVQVLKGQKPYRIEEGVSVIINWDILGYWADYLGKMGFKLLIGDEAQAIGNPKSKRSKAFISLSKKVRDCIVMSGTPARSKPSQFWTMLNITDPETFPSYEQYLYRYCDPTWTPFSALPVFKGADRVKELHSFICNCMIRRTKDDVMSSLPPKTMQVVPLEVDEGGMAEYEAMESEIGMVGDSKKAMREHVAGLMHTAYTLKEDSLIRWVEDFLDSGEKLLLFAWHRDVVDIIADKLKDYRPAKIYGGLTDKVRESEKQKFITDPACRVCVANIQAGGVGIDGFQNVCSNVAFAEFSHTPTDHRQAEDRLHRGGQCRAVTSYYLVATGTIDEEAVEILDERAKMLDGILDGKEACDIDLLSEILARHGVNV